MMMMMKLYCSKNKKICYCEKLLLLNESSSITFIHKCSCYRYFKLNIFCTIVYGNKQIKWETELIPRDNFFVKTICQCENFTRKSSKDNAAYGNFSINLETVIQHFHLNMFHKITLTRVSMEQLITNILLLLGLINILRCLHGKTLNFLHKKV